MAAHQAPLSLGFSRQEHEWVAISFSSAWKWKVKGKLLSVPPWATPWTAAYQAPPSMGFSKQEYWSGVLPSTLLVLCKWKEQQPGWQCICSQCLLKLKLRPDCSEKIPFKILFIDNASQMVLMVKNPPANAVEVWSLGWEDPLEEGMATHSSIP